MALPNQLASPLAGALNSTSASPTSVIAPRTSSVCVGLLAEARRRRSGTSSTRRQRDDELGVGHGGVRHRAEEQGDVDAEGDARHERARRNSVLLDRRCSVTSISTSQMTLEPSIRQNAIVGPGIAGLLDQRAADAEQQHGERHAEHADERRAAAAGRARSVAIVVARSAPVMPWRRLRRMSGSM